MRTITLTLIAAMFSSLSFAQTGATCNDAIPQTSNSTCVFTNHTTTTPEMWFTFTASSTDVQIRVVSEAFGTNTPHVHNISLFEGTCTNPNLIAQDELPFIAIANDLTVDASGLVPGNTYYIRAKVPASATACTAAACPGTTTVSFVLCIQDIEVFLPLDFSFVLDNFGVKDVPSSSHTYYTNKGQIVDTDGNPKRDILLYTTQSSPNVFVFDDHLSYVFAKRVAADTITVDTLHRVDMTLVGGNSAARAFKTEQVPGSFNYYLGHIPTGITNMLGYNKVVCNDVYPDIDMQYYSNSDGMKYYFIRQPGGNPNDIVMKFEGATSVDVTPDGGLIIATPLGTIDFDPGHAYAINPGGKVVPMPWQAKFMKVTANSVKFDIHSFPSFMPLVIQVDRGHSSQSQAAIDNLEWSTYWGGVEPDFFTDIKSDNSGNMYITGYTNNLNFPTLTGFYVDTAVNIGGDPDAILIKLNSNCEPEWTTIYGGDTNGVGNAGWGIDIANSVAVGNAGQVYIAGQTTSIDFPLFNDNNEFFDGTNGCFVNTSCWDIFIIRFDGNTGIPLWGTYYGADNVDELGSDIELDNNGNLYVVGHGVPSATPLLPATGASNFTSGNGVILKFDQTDSLVWATLFGTQQVSAGESINAIHIDPSNNIYICGTTVDPVSLNPIPIVNPGVNASFSGATDGFFAKFNSNDLLTTSTYIGGSSTDRANGITTDPSGKIYITGLTFSQDFPTQSLGDIGAYFVDTLTVQFTTRSDAFVTQLESDGQLRHSTYWGGFGDDQGIDIISGNDGLIYIGGNTMSDSSSFIPDYITIPFPNSTPPDVFIQPHMKGGPGFEFDGFVSAITPSFQIKWSTYFGGNSGDVLNAIHADDNKLYIAGYSQSSGQKIPLVDFNTSSTTDYYQDVKVGSWQDGFAARFDLSPVIILSDNHAVLGHSVLKVFPNPTTGKIFIPYQKFIGATISVFDVLGRHVISEQMPKRINGDGVFELDMTNVAKGVYVVRIDSEKERITSKFIVE
ncbi:hypothetical protein COB64_03750 [Candidatus Wolfebacteria bacterium]|nr:MAG: hypothetical protein COB64_03750 [Candidatus Wolfebacteria bacterium]